MDNDLIIMVDFDEDDESFVLFFCFFVFAIWCFLVNLLFDVNKRISDTNLIGIQIILIHNFLLNLYKII